MSGIPTEQAIYARLQDAEHKAKDLDPAKPHREKELAAGEAEQACAELSAHFAEREAGWRLRLARYRETRARGD